MEAMAQDSLALGDRIHWYTTMASLAWFGSLAANFFTTPASGQLCARNLCEAASPGSGAKPILSQLRQ